MNHAQKMNIFDSMFISVELPRDYVSVVFESLVMNQFVFDYKLPLSKHSTIQMHFEVLDKKPPINRDAFEKMMISEHARESFFLAHWDEALHSPQLKTYILEYKEIVRDH